MNLKRLVIVAILALFCVVASPAQANLTLSVINGAALEGNYGLRVSFDGTTSNAYVQDNSPTNEGEYHVTFSIRADGMNMNPETSIQVFRAFEETSGNQAFRLNLYRRPNGAATVYAFHILPANSGGGFYPRIAEGLRPGGDAFTVMWKKGAAETIRLYRNGNFRKKATGLNTNTFDVDFVRLGAGLGSTGGFGLPGSFLDLDNFISTRSCQTGACNE